MRWVVGALAVWGAFDLTLRLILRIPWWAGIDQLRRRKR